MEEEINICEEFINLSFLYGKLSFTKTQLYEYQTAIKNLLTRYKQLEKENEKLNQLKEKHNVRINDLCALVDNFAYNSIPVSLVEEKIEEARKEYKQVLDSMERRISHTKDEHKIRSYYADFGVKRGRLEICEELLREE